VNPESTPLAPPTQSPPAHHAPNGGFRNPWPGSTPTGLSGLFRWAIERSRQTRPAAPAPPQLHTPAVVRPRGEASDLRVTAIGHSTFLLQIGGLNILTDPVFGERASPLPFAGPRRHHAPGLALDALPPIDIVLQSHDHYDHLDDAAVRHIAQAHPAATWCAPLGVAARLRERGVREIVERDWWGSAHVGAAAVTCVPAAHFSGRTPFDRDRTLWCGWAVTIGDRRIYFVGDTGFHPLFSEIGARLGPIDMVFMPVGAYEPRWFMKPVHLDPDEALEAFAGLTRPHDTHATIMVAMHWGTFTLTDEPMDEPPRRTQIGWAHRGWAADRLWILNPGETRAVRSVR
jgi:N-acyl-phosphatidylethanolamine-hydrolysing phospholipase D